MNLLEGNIWPGICDDGYHGSASHDTIFRNHINGLHSTRSNDRWLLNLCRGTYYNSVVGNVLGDSSWEPVAYSAPPDVDHTQGMIYRLGYPNSGGNSLTPAFAWPTYPGVYPDPSVSSTLLRHGNYDFYNKDVVWDGAIASRAIPDSFYFSARPAFFFGSFRWPPIGPDVSGLVTSIPAKARWEAYLSSSNLDDIFRE
jgi:hypothetical protein